MVTRRDGEIERDSAAVASREVCVVGLPEVFHSTPHLLRMPVEWLAFSNGIVSLYFHRHGVYDLESCNSLLITICATKSQQSTHTAAAVLTNSAEEETHPKDRQREDLRNMLIVNLMALS